MQVKTQACKAKAIHQQHPETLLPSLGPSSFQIVFGNHGRRVLRRIEEKDHPDRYQHTVQKPASVMEWGCVSAHGMSNLTICDGTIDAGSYIQVLEKHMLPLKQRLFQGRSCLSQQDKAKPHSERVTTTRLCSKNVRILDWPACSPYLSPIEYVWYIMKRKIRQQRPQNEMVHQARMGKNSTYKASTISVLSSNFIGTCRRNWIQNKSIFTKNSKVHQFEH